MPAAGPGVDLDALDLEPPALDDLMAKRRGEPARRTEALLELSGWLARFLAMALVVLMLAVVVRSSSRSSLLLPYPWLAEQRTTMENNQRISTYVKIDRAARTYFLLHGQYPEDLGTLVEVQLLSQSDLYDPQGRWLSYGSTEREYVLQPLEGKYSVPGGERTGEMLGDFFLNPSFAELPPKGSTTPIELLD
jgi:hypothetical protein